MIDMNPIVSDFRVITKKIIEIEMAHPDAKLPKCADAGSSGFDLCSVESVVIEPGERRIVSTGLKWNPNDNTLEMQIRPRSGLAAKYGITVLNAPGTIDASYRGIIGVILYNTSDQAYQIPVGERIAQAVIAKVEKGFEFEVVKKVSESERGEGGFGSTGKM